MPKNFLTFNIRRSVYQSYGIEAYKHLQCLFHLIPVINNSNTTIQQRAKIIKQAIYKQLGKLQHNKTSQINLASYSVSGIDARYALSMLGLGKICKSLTTIGTPHKGSKAAQMAQRRTFKQQIFDPVTRMMGIGLRPFGQFVPENMTYFNSVVKDCKQIKYYSIGGQRLPVSCFPSLRKICDYLRVQKQYNFTYQNDGVFGNDQIIWGDHLINFQADHFELLGITSNSSHKIPREIKKMIKQLQQQQKGKKKLEQTITI